MKPYFALSIIFSLTALFVADERGQIFTQVFRKSVEVKDKTRIRVRLEELGRSTERDYENFRIYQMTLISSLTALLFTLSIFRLISLSITLAGFCIIIPAVIYSTEKGLTKRVIKRREIIESEFPALIELLTLAIGAGESPSVAVKRIAGRATGALPSEFQQITKEIENGKSFTFALDSLSRKAKSPVVRRFADLMAIAISRGTPLVETLTHSVREARSAERIKMLNIAAKAEISMMIPVVFLILPISILFAMFPSMASLDLFTS
jgi:tight adherence protein C